MKRPEFVASATQCRRAQPFHYDVGVGGGIDGKVEAGGKALYRAENKPFQSRSTLSTLRENRASVDVVGFDPSILRTNVSGCIESTAGGRWRWLQRIHG
jgi:hypothetical protein